MAPLRLVNEKPNSHFRVPDSVRVFASVDRGAVTTTNAQRRSIPCSRRVHVTDGPGHVSYMAGKGRRERSYEHLVDFPGESYLLLESDVLVFGIEGTEQAAKIICVL
jgi:hypothetical protein